MGSGKISRRGAVGVLGAGAAATLVLTRGAQASAAPGAGSSARAAGGPAASRGQASPLRRLLAPLNEGEVLDRWRLVALRETPGEAAAVVLEDAEGRRFQVDICAASAGAPRGPAETERFSLYLANGGDGALASLEDHGLAAMALAEIVRTNEADAEPNLLPAYAASAAKARRHA